MLFSVLSLLTAVIYLQLIPKLYESRTVVEVGSKSGQAKLTQLQSALEGELLERQAQLTKAQGDRDSALAELQADERLGQRELISALDFKKAQIAATELSANYEVEKKRYESARINNVQDFDAGDNGGEQDVNLDEDIKTVEQAMLSDTLLLGVLKSNGLEKDPSFAPPKKDGSAYLDSELVARFRSRVKAAVRHGTRLIDVSVKDTDPRRAPQLAGAIVKAFIDQNPEEPYANNRLRQQADQLKAKLAQGVSGRSIRVLETPLVAAKPSEPAPLTILLLALLGGAGLGCALVIICDMADHSIRSVDQAERISGLSVLAAIPESRRRNLKKEPVLTTDPASFEAEAFRTLRTVIAFLGPYADHKTLLFTSVAPAAPALAELLSNAAYRESVEKSDLAVSDSSLMVILWKLLAGQHLDRTSGPGLLRALLDSDQLREPGNSVWIMPSEGESQINVAYLNKIGIPVSAKDCYIAPHYPKGEPGFDLELLVWIEERKPRYVIINIGGGIQEPLGLYLKENLCYRPSIICVGSAIAFFSGIQASLPRWIDKCMLGWLSRCLHSPAKFVPRYWGALRAIPIMIKYRERSVTSAA